MKFITVASYNNSDSFIALLVNWYNNGLLPLIRQFFLIPIRINEFMISDHNVLPPAGISSVGI
jgi:hypothetical protein